MSQYLLEWENKDIHKDPVEQREKKLNYKTKQSKFQEKNVLHRQTLVIFVTREQTFRV